ncbi:MAG: succinylglutamate desuccinylase/aspartoacylase family protein [Armatimonadota bacterium]
MTKTRDELSIGGHLVGPGERRAIRLPITTGLNGAELALWVHVVRGRTPGPVLTLLSTLHGGEWFSIDVLRQIVRGTDPATLQGAVIAVPVANPPALARQTRNMPDESDSPDLNRIFPGTHTWTSDQLASAIAREVMPQASCLLDFHMGPWGSAFQDILIGDDYPQPGLSDETERLALAFGSPIIRRAKVVSGFPGPKSSIGYAGGVLGIPALGVEVGGVGFGPRLEDIWRQRTVDGVRAVMGALGMIDGAPNPRPSRQLIYRTGHRVNPTKGGFLRSSFGGDALGREVDKGTLLGEVMSPYTLTAIEQLRAPARGLLFYVARDYPVRPGDWAFGIANTEDGTARWVENATRAVGGSR